MTGILEKDIVIVINDTDIEILLNHDNKKINWFYSTSRTILIRNYFPYRSTSTTSIFLEIPKNSQIVPEYLYSKIFCKIMYW